ncbi:hypothetical protein BCF46_1176 [Litoreibacter meonggei]|uniref:CBU-0592-like domain-containing protein n=1 Tax=Litoreibacter meonggei TaxID=1049199 RepID=A0A497X3Z0_9RHOB|nr:hypothetical protein [Litoreibacter meonggei]RLJ59034.1 hypothetical protein BCF46_1176 [Litoreibacter meonggei]
MDQATVYQVIGVCGFLFYMAGYAGVQLGWLDGNGCAYCLSNTIGACLVLVSLCHSFNLASALIQITWIFLGVLGLYRRRVAVASAHQLG